MIIEIDNILDVKKHIEGLQAVVFDLDDTLYSEKEYVRSGYRKISQRFSEIPDAYNRLWAAFENKKPAIDEVIPPEYKKEALTIYRSQMPDINLYQGVDEMLRYFLSKEMQLGIITDGRPEGQRAKIKALHLEAYFKPENIIITDELGGPEFRKPNLKAYELLQEKFGVPYEKMAYIGDNSKKDFIAPQKLRMKAIHFVNKDGLYI